MAAARWGPLVVGSLPGSSGLGCKLRSLRLLAVPQRSTPKRFTLSGTTSLFFQAGQLVGSARCSTWPPHRFIVGCDAQRRSALPAVQRQQRRSSGTLSLPVTTANRLLEWFGFVGLTKFSKSAMRLAGMRLYICATEYCDYRALMAVAGLPDTFNSWFLLTELHVWLIMVRLAAEGKEGRFVRNQLVHSMWEDVDARSKKILEGGSSVKRREGIETFNNMFKGALFAYDEGLLSDDRVLAAALWRNMFDMKACEPQSLELMVQYVRKQLWHLEKQDSALIVSKGFLTFLPYDSETVDTEHVKQVKSRVSLMR